MKPESPGWARLLGIEPLDLVLKVLLGVVKALLEAAEPLIRAQ